MKKRLFVFIISISLLLGMVSCNTTSKIMPSDKAQRIALVSLTVNNFAGSLAWDLGDRLIWNEVDKMFSVTERELGGRWTIVPASDFISDKNFQELASDMPEVAVPVVNDHKLPFFGESRKDLISSSIPVEKLKDLIEITGANYIAVVYSEWGVATGSFIPTSKAETKNIIRVYDMEGNTIYYNRIDVMGGQTLGGMGIVRVAEDTINQWVDSYISGLYSLLN